MAAITWNIQFRNNTKRLLFLARDLIPLLLRIRVEIDKTQFFTRLHFIQLLYFPCNWIKIIRAYIFIRFKFCLFVCLFFFAKGLYVNNSVVVYAFIDITPQLFCDFCCLQLICLRTIKVLSPLFVFYSGFWNETNKMSLKSWYIYIWLIHI